MSDLSLGERLRLERLLGMRTGYVGGFNNGTFQEFVFESTGVDIYSDDYAGQGNSKANRLRTFWQIESNATVSKLLRDMSTHWWQVAAEVDSDFPPEELLRIAQRLAQESPNNRAEEALLVSDNTNFDVLARAIIDAVDAGKSSSALDRLHTYLVKFFRERCDKHQVPYGPKTPLNSLAGGYYRKLRDGGYITSNMTDLTLRSSIPAA